MSIASLIVLWVLGFQVSYWLSESWHARNGLTHWAIAASNIVALVAMLTIMF